MQNTCVLKLWLALIFSVTITCVAHGDTWTFANTNPATNASINGSFPQFTITSAQTFGIDDSVIPNTSTYTTTIDVAEAITYHWHVSGLNPYASWLDAGYVLNGMFMVLDVNQGRANPAIIDGMETINLQPGDVFGFYINSSTTKTPPIVGVLSIDASSSVTTPEPSSFLLLGSGVTALAGMIRRRMILL